METENKEPTITVRLKTWDIVCAIVYEVAQLTGHEGSFPIDEELRDDAIAFLKKLKEKNNG